MSGRPGPEVVAVSDPEDPRLVDYRDLRDRELRGRAEGRVAVVEGVVALRRVLAAGHRLRSALVTPSRRAELGPALDGVPVVYLAPRDVLRRTVGFDLHRGAVGIAEVPEPPPLDALLATARRLVVGEALNDHENLGTLARSAAALGADALLLSPTSADPYYRRAVRVSLGSVFLLPVLRLDDWPAALGRLRSAGFVVVALTPAPDAVDLDDLALAAEPRVALLVGAEGPGLTAAAMRAADIRVRIPVRAEVDSLNVAAAAAIALHVSRLPTGR